MKFFVYLFIVCIPILANDKSYSLDYIYVNANTGQSSGGHSAIRFGDLVYHFQYYPDKIFHVVREPWREFRYVYGIQENRTILIHKVHLTKQDYNFFLERMNEIYLIQKKELDNLIRLDNDLKIIESLAIGDKTVNLKAAGYFSKLKKKNTRYNNLQEKINRNFEKNFILTELNSLRKQINSFTIPSKSASSVIVTKHKYPKAVENFSTEYLDLLSLQKAYEILYEGLDLSAGSYFEYKSDLNSIVFQQFSQFLLVLEKEIIGLLQSKTSNRGYSLLATIARYLVIQKSIEENKIFILDSFGKNHSLVIGEVIHNKEFLKDMNIQITNKISTLFKDFESGGVFSSKDYTVLEDGINRQKEILAAIQQSHSIRINSELMTPIKEESVSIDYAQVSKETLKDLLTKAIINKRDYELNLQSKYSFNLFRKNCTTEIFNSLNDFLKNNDSESTEKLGGIVNGDDSLVFIPVYAYYAVGKNYNVVAGETIPSLRYILNEKYSTNESSFSLRESTTLTSRFYRFNNEDSFFIFFTDDVIWKRPIYGFVNLMGGLGELSFGILSFPFDKGDHFIKGLQGIFFSGPEIVFFNIRKGTFVYEGKPEWIELNNTK